MNKETLHQDINAMRVDEAMKESKYNENIHE